MSQNNPKPEARAGRSFLAVTRVGSLVGGSTSRSCTIYLDSSHRIQMADEETNGILHGLAEGSGDTAELLRTESQGGRAATTPAPAHPPPPTTEFYAARLAVTSLSAGGDYAADSYEASAAPRDVVGLIRRVESDVRARSLQAAPAGLYGRARRQLNFDPEIETLHATFSEEQIHSSPVLSSLIQKEMFLVYLGPPGEPVLLAKDLKVTPGRAVRVKVGALVYIVQAYELRDRGGQAGELCPAPSRP